MVGWLGGVGWGGGRGRVKSKALPKLECCAAGLKITPGQKTMFGQNDHCSHNSVNYKNS